MRVDSISSRSSYGTMSVRLLAAYMLLHQVALVTAAEQGQGLPRVQHHDTITPPSTASAPSTRFHFATASGTMFERIGSYLFSVMPDAPEFPDYLEGNGGLYEDEGSTSLAWGGSTLEVVKTQASYLTRPAAFGPRIVDDNGLRGTLLPISDFYKTQSKADGKDAFAVDNYGCPYNGGPGWRDDGTDQDPERDRLPGERAVATPPSDWIALIERGGNCSFIAKVRVAQALKAKAVVVGDAPSPSHNGRANDPGFSGRLVTMFAPGDTSDVRIPSTFVTRPSYDDLLRLVDEATQDEQAECAQRKKHGKTCEVGKRGVEVILWRDDEMWEWPLIDLAFILLMLPSFMTLVTIIVHRIRMVYQRRKERAPEVAVLNLPCLIWRGNGQPWEKVEEGTIVGSTGADGSIRLTKPADEEQIVSASQRFSLYRAKASAWLGKRFPRRSVDMESGIDAEADQSALLLAPSNADAPSNEAGPSTLPSSATNTAVLKTTPVAPPAPPSDQRTYYSCDECAICLSDFVDGDMVRVLPCGHVFHLEEIDSWLLKVKKLCPICKRDITIPVPPMIPAPALHPSSSSSGDGTSSAHVNADEQTPLLTDHDDE